MKKLFSWMMFYFWGLTVAIPVVYKIIFHRFPHIYSVIMDCPENYMMRAAIMMTLFTLSVMFIIWIMPVGASNIRPGLKVGTWYFYIIIFARIITLILGGGITELRFMRTLVTGATIGSILSIFCDISTLFLLFVLYEKRKINLIISSFLYVLYTFLLASRAGAIFVGVVLVGVACASDKILEYKKQIRQIIVFIVIISPFVFVLSTNNRGGMRAGDTIGEVVELIAGRCSNIELDGIILFQSDKGVWNKKIFEEKYGITNQFQLAVNSLVPGDIFQSDVNPNQYYRTVTGYMTEADAAKYYSSSCMTLPTYLSVKYGYFVGMVLSVIFVIAFYLVCVKLEKSMLGCCAAVILLQELVVFFDWVMFVQAFKRTVLTVLTLYIFQNMLERNRGYDFKRIRRIKIRLR